MGSVNGNEFLNDPTGSRRFLPFEVTSVNIKAAQNLNMDLVWSQAKHFFEMRERYWFNDEEIQELNTRNAEFSMISQEEELLNFYYRNTEMPDMFNTIKFLPPSIILSQLELKSRLRLSLKKLGEALNKLGLKKERKMVNNKFTWGYLIFEKTDDEIQQQTNINNQTEAF